MSRTYVAAKLHGLAVTACRLDYHGSVTIPAELLEAAGIDAFEQVHVVNLANGKRWVTYALPGEPGAFELNGGGAHLGVVGDRCVVMTYRQADAFGGALAVHIDGHNQPTGTVRYAHP